MEQEAVMSGKYVRVDDVMELINTSNRGSCDYFIVDQIEELCSSEKIYNLDKVIEQLKYNVKLYVDKEGEKVMLDEAIEIVKGGGVE